MPFTTDTNRQNNSLIFLHQTHIHSQIIYSITLLAVILGALPFLYTTISVKGVSLVQSSKEKTELFAPVSGRLVSVNLNDNQKVKKVTRYC